MTLHVYTDLEQGTEEWLAARRGILTASVVGQLITAKTIKPADNDYSRALTMTLAAERITGWSDPVYVNQDMMRGTFEEPIARDAYAQHMGVDVEEIGFMVLERDGWRLGFSPDGLVGDDGCIEIKSRRAKAQVMTVLADEVPASNMAQCQAGLLVSGRAWLDYVSFSGGLPLYVKRVYPDLRWFEVITAAARLFEMKAAAIVADYTERTAGMPATERTTFDMELVI